MPVMGRAGSARPPRSSLTRMELTVSSKPQAQQRTPDAITQMLLAVVQQLAIELHPHKHNTLTVTLDSALERDLGFDSLGRMELLLRLERALGCSCPNRCWPPQKCSVTSSRPYTRPA